MNLRCYCCGEPLGERFVLAAQGVKRDTFDRVFLMNEKCAKVATEAQQMIVTKVKP